MVDIWQSSLRPALHLVARQLDDHIFLVNLDTNAVFELNATGAEIWHWLERNHSLAGCIDHLRQKFDIDEVALREQLEPLVTELVQEGLLVRLPSGGV